jgi:hypothetical protein
MLSSNKSFSLLLNGNTEKSGVIERGVPNPVGPSTFYRIRNRPYQALGPNPDNLMKKTNVVDPEPYGTAFFLGRLDPDWDPNSGGKK